jgi:hypothetical protein
MMTLAMVFAAVVALGIYTLLHPPLALQAQSIELVDESGNTVALLGVRDQRTGIFIMDEKSTVRVSLFHSAEADGLYVSDAEGVTRIGAAQFAHGGGGFALHGPDSKGAAVLYYKQAGSLRFFNSQGEEVLKVAAPDSELEPNQ